jgi:hypothetical protein
MSIDRNAEYLWRQTLSKIDTVFGRLEYLSSLRNQHTGRYEHHGLGLRMGVETSHFTLLQSHEAAFADWVSFSLEAQKRELSAYLSQREEPGEEIVKSWIRVKPFPTWIPETTRSAERALFLSDLDILLELLRREMGVVLTDPDA